MFGILIARPMRMKNLVVFEPISSLLSLGGFSQTIPAEGCDFATLDIQKFIEISPFVPCNYTVPAI